MQRGIVFLATLILLSCALTATAGESLLPDATKKLMQEVWSTEEAFAKTMADRDPAAFATFIADEAIFFGRQGEIRGRDTVLATWKGFFEGKEAPFSWRPDNVAVLDSGTLALSTGPVFTNGKKTGVFNSIWRKKADGKWEIIFDKGCAVCANE